MISESVVVVIFAPRSHPFLLENPIIISYFRNFIGLHNYRSSHLYLLHLNVTVIITMPMTVAVTMTVTVTGGVGMVS